MFSAFTVENQAPDFACTHRRQGSLKMAEAAGVLFLGFFKSFSMCNLLAGGNILLMQLQKNGSVANGRKG